MLGAEGERGVKNHAVVSDLNTCEDSVGIKQKNRVT